jgi:hypothetical protein
MIFSPTTSFADKALEATLGFGPKYSAAAKLAAFETLLPQTGNKQIEGITSTMTGFSGGALRLLIVGFDYDRNRASFFRSEAVDGVCLGVFCPGTITLAEAMHASTNAPINYFDAPAIFPERPERYWDGGVSGFNNPVLAAVTEAIIRGVAPQNIAALSLGTGSVQLQPALPNAPSSAFTQAPVTSNLLNDLTKMASAILDDPPDSASFIAHAMTLADGKFAAPAVSRIVRASPLVAPVSQGGSLHAPGSMTPAQFQYLCNIGMDAVQQAEVTAIAAYADLWLAGTAPNQLIHSNANVPPYELGYHSFPQALLAWQAIA